MTVFKYTAKNRSGKKISGMLEADNQNLAIETLRKKELIPISLSEEKAKRRVSGRKVKLDDLVIFSRQLATMVDSGIPLVQALSILGEQVQKENFRQVILRIRQDIEEGAGFCDALAKHTAVFSPLYINMVKAGEASGLLNEILDRLANYLEKASALQRKVKSSLTYPIVVIAMALIITIFLLVKVVPTFRGIFDMLGGTLPLPTRILIGFSDMLRHSFLYIVIFLVGVVFLLKKWSKTPRGRRTIDYYLLKLPVFGPLLKKVAIAKFSRTLSTLVRSGVPILGSLEIVGKTAGNKIVEEALDNARKSIKEGEPISGPLSESDAFPPMVVRMIAVGEQTGELEKMLSKIADFYDEQVDATVSSMTSLIEPMVIAFLGVIIGGIVVSLFLPIFKITELLGR
ncbi:MAG: type II secretion system F family protein [Candidatus Omnitrophica bacterium]|nr:type II secretion system F family protein [Candidatus Omnitrophota bacterium]